MFNLNACIFDLDGVLVDTARYHFMAWKKLADELGIAFTESDNEDLKGVSRSASLQYILSKGGKTVSEDRFNELMHLKNNWYLELIQHMNPDEILPNADILLNDLRENGILIGLGSASKNARLILERTGLLRLFDTIADGTRTSRSKPDPEVFLLAASDLGVEPHHTIVFEDAVNGIDAALKGGFKTIGIGNAQVLSKADYVFPDLTSLRYSSIKQLAF
jgi:beta-phosphoglucomutase